MINCYIYVHHAFSLGHFQRSKLLAEGLSSYNKYNIILFSSGVPVPTLKAAIPKEISFIQLPSEDVICSSTKKNRKDLKKNIYKQRIEKIIKCFSKAPPRIFITEFFPFAKFRLDKTLIPILKHIRINYPNCKIICSARDFPISWHEKLKKYNFDKLKKILNKYYDLVLIHARKNLSSFKRGGFFYKFSCNVPIYFTEYVVNTELLQRKQFRKRKKNILVTAGGGRDGPKLISLVLKAVEIINNSGSTSQQLHLNIVSGPFGNSRFEEGKKKKWCVFFKGMSNVAKMIAQSDLVLCMAGYNTSIEVLASNIAAIIFPLEKSLEQHKRAKAISKMKNNILVQKIDSSPSTIAKKIKALLELKNDSKTNATDISLFNGVINTAKIIDNLCKGKIKNSNSKFEDGFNEQN